ncbi:MAG: ATP-binding protein [Bacteroidetes bacterium]|nr:ATP-binding protein [Bacteroidota bacterium]
MKSSTGRWVSGENFFDREIDLKILRKLIRDRNHVLLTGQRRMGKTSILQELGRQLKDDGWIFLFCDVEGAKCPEDVIAEMAYFGTHSPVAHQTLHWRDGSTDRKED